MLSMSYFLILRRSPRKLIAIGLQYARNSFDSIFLYYIQMDNLENSAKAIICRSQSPKIGSNPVYITPKDFSLPYQDNENYIEKGGNNEQQPHHEQPKTTSQQQKQILQEQLLQQYSSVPPLLIILSIIIWIGYAFGSIQSKPLPINIAHIFDIIALVLSVPAIFLNIISNCKLQLLDLVHIYSIILTIVFFSYQSEPFSPIMNGLRGLRLLFPLFFINATRNNLTIFKVMLLKNMKYAFLCFFIIIIFGIAALQLFPGVLYFRCRPTEIPNQYYWPAIGSSLCGSEQCSNSTFCRSPLQFGLKPLSFQILTEPSLYYGMINFDNIYQSTKAIFEIGSLNAAFQAFKMLSQNQNPLVLSVLFLFLIVITRIIYSLFILENFDALQKVSKKQIKNLSSEKNSTQQIDLNLAVSVDLCEKTSDNSPIYTFQNTTWIQKIFIISKHVLCVIHVVLVTMFNSPQLNSFDQIIGICLSIVFILWSVFFGFQVYYFFTDFLSQKEMQWFCFEALLYIVAVCDYIARVQMQIYIMQQKSYLTPLSHALITLRLLHLAIYNLFDKQLSIFGNTLMRAGKNLLKFVFYFVIVSIVGTLMYAFVDKKGQSFKELLVQINFSMMLLYNFSWFQIRKDQFSTIQSSTIQIVLILIGLFIFLPYAYSKMMQKIFEQRQKLQKREMIQDSVLQEMNKNELSYEQKSFCCIDIQNSMRKLLIQFLQHQRYTTGRSIFYIGYCIFVIFGKVLLDQQGYSITSLIAESIIFLDTIFQIFCKGFCGKKSFTQNRLIIMSIVCLNPILFILFITNSGFGFLRLLQLSRIFFYIFQNKEQNNFWGFLIGSLDTFKRFFVYLLITIFALMNMLIIPILANNGGELSKFDGVKKTFVSSIILLFEKGFSWGYIINFSQNSSFMNIYGVTFIIIASFSINLLLYSTLIITLYMNFHKKHQESLIKQNPSLSYQSIQKRAVQQYILSLQPSINPSSQTDSESFLVKFYCSHIYQFFILCIQICSLLCLILLWPHIQIKLRFFICTFHLICLLTECIIFIVQIYAFGYNTSNIWLRLATYLLCALPGSILIFVPPLQYSSNSFPLKIIILLFCCLVVFRLIEILSHFKNWYSQIFDKLSNIFWKMSDFIIFFIILLGCSIVIIQDNLQFRQSRLSEFSYSLGVAITSLMGGSFSNFLIKDNQQINDLKTIVVLSLICIFSIIMHSLFMSYLFYIFSESRGTQLDQFKSKFKNFTEYWQKIDKTGSGVTCYKNVLYFSKALLPFFSISKSLGGNYELRKDLFKSLNMPVYIFKDQQTQQRKYVILMHDVIYFFYRIPDYFEKKMVRKQSEFQQQLQQWTEKSYKKAPKGICKTFLKSSQIYYAFTVAKKIKRKLFMNKNKKSDDEVVRITGFQEVQNELCESIANTEQHKHLMSSQRLMAPKIGHGLKLSTLGQAKNPAADSQRFRLFTQPSKQYGKIPKIQQISQNFNRPLN